MNNMRRGFTMIELIFVIVIIGILAAVAIPKLAATRDDAKLTQAIADAKTCVNDAGAAYTAGTAGTTGTDLTSWTKSPACVAASANTLVTASTWTTNAVTITDTTGSAPASLITTHTFGGSRVSY